MTPMLPCPPSSLTRTSIAPLAITFPAAGCDLLHSLFIVVPPPPTNRKVPSRGVARHHSHSQGAGRRLRAQPGGRVHDGSNHAENLGSVHCHEGPGFDQASGAQVCRGAYAWTAVAFTYALACTCVACPAIMSIILLNSSSSLVELVNLRRYRCPEDVIAQRLLLCSATRFTYAAFAKGRQKHEAHV